MDSYRFPGCCAINIFGYLGGAENVTRYKSKEAFVKALFSKQKNRIIMATTIKYQNQERLWLEELGFSTVECAHMFIHYIEGRDLTKNIQEYFYKIKEEQKLKVLPLMPPPFEGLIKIEDIKNILNNQDQPLHIIFNEYYKLSLPGFVITEIDIEAALRARVFILQKMRGLRSRIYRYVTEHRNRFRG